jgi:hypothetical protein
VGHLQQECDIAVAGVGPDDLSREGAQRDDCRVDPWVGQHGELPSVTAGGGFDGPRIHAGASGWSVSVY